MKKVKSSICRTRHRFGGWEDRPMKARLDHSLGHRQTLRQGCLEKLGRAGETGLEAGKTFPGSENTPRGFCGRARGSEKTARGFCERARGSEKTARGFCEMARGFEKTARGFCEMARGSEKTARGFCGTARGFEKTRRVFRGFGLGLRRTFLAFGSLALDVAARRLGAEASPQDKTFSCRPLEAQAFHFWDGLRWPRCGCLFFGRTPPFGQGQGTPH